MAHVTRLLVLAGCVRAVHAWGRGEPLTQGEPCFEGLLEGLSEAAQALSRLEAVAGSEDATAEDSTAEVLLLRRCELDALRAQPQRLLRVPVMHDTDLWPVV